jgi:hypothetical protein
MGDYGVYVAAAIAVIGFWIALKIVKKLLMAALIAVLILGVLLFLAGVV